MMNMQFLKWLYKERKLCRWCHHPSKNVETRGLCRGCYRLALDFRKRPTPALAVAVDFALSEGTINAYNGPITGLEIEHVFRWVARAAFPFRKDIDDPFFHSASTWGKNFTDLQRRILFHHFSMVHRELVRRARRERAWSVAMDLHLDEKANEIKQYMIKAVKAVKAVFPPVRRVSQSR